MVESHEHELKMVEKDRKRDAEGVGCSDRETRKSLMMEVRGSHLDLGLPGAFSVDSVGQRLQTL